jgi:hypothetical protein
MVTLLLTFFVMLLSLSSVQDPELFNIGRDSFVESIENFGLGILFGRTLNPNFGKSKIEYFINNPDKFPDTRTIDAKREETRRIFKKVSRSMSTMPSQIVAKTTNFSVTNIHFSLGDATLNESAKRFLTEFYLGLQQEPNPLSLKLYVLGLADDAPTEKAQWILSAKRAQAVADFLKETPLGSNCPVYSWGAGPGGNWVGQDSPASKQSQILISVLREND